MYLSSLPFEDLSLFPRGHSTEARETRKLLSASMLATLSLHATAFNSTKTNTPKSTANMLGGAE